jgi:hypothetical protein
MLADFGIVTVKGFVTIAILYLTYRLVNPSITVGRYGAAICGLFLTLIIWSVDLQTVSRVALLGIQIDRKIETANEAIKRLEDLENRAKATEARLAKSRDDVFEVAQAVIEIAEILPRTGGYGGGLSDKDTAILKKQLDFLRNKLNEIKNPKQ